jgi:restriction system protein
VPSDSSKYLDQEFINYLKENTQDLDRIHWRNFERLVAEFFNKVGYHVKLGPGTNDGGIDIRVWADHNSSEGPPLMLIQCKRYSKGNQVSVDTVKAFYSDVIHEEAGVGLIATTSSLASGGKKVINVRGYNISIAESEEIKKMVYEMWRESFKY